MVAVASVAVVATSPPFSELRQDHDGISFEVSPDANEVRLPFEFEVSDAARQAGGLASFRFSVVWRGVDPSEGPVLEVAVVNVRGDWVTSASRADDIYLSCSTECFGGGEVLITWPPDLDHGGATVDWTAKAAVSFDSDSPPEGATLQFSIVDPPAPVSEIVAEGQVSSRNPQEPRIVSRQRVELTADRPGGEYWLEVSDIHPPVQEGQPAVFMTTSGSTTRLEEAGSVLVSFPPNCEPCTWSADLVVVHESTRAWVDWRLRNIGTPDTATVETVDTTAPELETHIEGGQITLRGNERTVVPVRLDVSAAAVNVADFEELAPHVMMHLNTIVEDATTEFPGGARFERQIISDVSPGSGQLTWANSPVYNNTHATQPPMTKPAKLECSASGCWLDFQVAFETVDFRRGSITFTWDLNAALSYPFATEVPVGADMSMAIK